MNVLGPLSRVVVLYDDSEEPSDDFTVYTVDRYEPGWVTLVRLVLCPNECQGGDVWGGEGLVICRVCGGNAHVAVGVGGAYLERSSPVPVPEEPSLTDYANRLRRFIAAPSSAPEEIDHDGHKVFIVQSDDAVMLEAVTDDGSGVRLSFVLSAGEAREIGDDLYGAAGALTA